MNFGADATNNAVAGNDANADGDDLSNLQEYAFNTDPWASNTTHTGHSFPRGDKQPALPRCHLSPGHRGE